MDESPVIARVSLAHGDAIYQLRPSVGNARSATHNKSGGDK